RARRARAAPRRRPGRGGRCPERVFSASSLTHTNHEPPVTGLWSPVTVTMIEHVLPLFVPGGSQLERSNHMAVDLEQELKRTTEQRGFRFGLHDFVAQVHGADALKKHNDATEANYLKKGKLDRKTKELAIVVACVALKDSADHLECEMHPAHNAREHSQE